MSFEILGVGEGRQKIIMSDGDRGWFKEKATFESQRGKGGHHSYWSERGTPLEGWVTA